MSQKENTPSYKPIGVHEWDWRDWILTIGANLAPPECFFHPNYDDDYIEREWNPIKVGTIGLVEERRRRSSKDIHPKELAMLSSKEQPRLVLAEVTARSGLYIKYHILEMNAGYAYWALVDEGAFKAPKPKNDSDPLRGGSVPSAHANKDGYQKKMAKLLEDKEDKLQIIEHSMKIMSDQCPVENKFKPGMLLLAADKKQLDGLMYVAVVTEVNGDKVTLHFPGWGHEDDITVNYWYRHMFPFENAEKAKMMTVIPETPDQNLLHPSTAAKDLMRNTPGSDAVQHHQTAAAGAKHRRLAEQEKQTGIEKKVKQLLKTAKEQERSQNTTAVQKVQKWSYVRQIPVKPEHVPMAPLSQPSANGPTGKTYHIVGTGRAKSTSISAFLPSQPQRASSTNVSSVIIPNHMAYFGPEHPERQAIRAHTDMPVVHDGKTMTKKALYSVVASEPALAAMRSGPPAQNTEKPTTTHRKVVQEAPQNGFENIAIEDEEQATEDPSTVGIPRLNGQSTSTQKNQETREAETGDRENPKSPHLGVEKSETFSDEVHKDDPLSSAQKTSQEEPQHEVKDEFMDFGYMAASSSTLTVRADITAPTVIRIPPGVSIIVQRNPVQSRRSSSPEQASRKRHMDDTRPSEPKMGRLDVGEGASSVPKLNGNHRSHEERQAPAGPSSRPPKQRQARPWFHYEDYEDRPVQKLLPRKQWEVKVRQNCHCGPLLDSNAVASLRDMPKAPFSSVLPDVLERIVRCAKSKERVLGLLRTVSQNEEHFEFHGCFVPKFSDPVAAWLYLKEFLLRINACPKLFSLRQKPCQLCGNLPRESSRQNLFKVDVDIAQTSNVPIPTCKQLSVEFTRLGRNYRLFILQHGIASEWLQCLEGGNLREVLPGLSRHRLEWINDTALFLRQRLLSSDERHADRFPANWREYNGQ